MAGKQQKIKTRAWVHKGGELVNVDTLSPEERVQLATWLKLTYLNALYAGEAVFRVAEEHTKEKEDEHTSMQGVSG